MMSILGTIESLKRARAMCDGPSDGSRFSELFSARDGGMTDNQLAEQWYAYRLHPEFDYPHTLNKRTVDAALRKQFRL